MTYGKSVLALVVLSCISVSAQQITGSMRGTVTDPTGAVVQGATVTAQETDTGFTRSTTTDHGATTCCWSSPSAIIACKSRPRIFGNMCRKAFRST